MTFLKYFIYAALMIYSLGMIYVYLAGEYTEGAFVKKFWPYYFPLVMLVVLVMVIESNERRKK